MRYWLRILDTARRYSFLEQGELRREWRTLGAIFAIFLAEVSIGFFSLGLTFVLILERADRHFHGWLESFPFLTATEWAFYSLEALDVLFFIIVVRVFWRSIDEICMAHARKLANMILERYGEDGSMPGGHKRDMADTMKQLRRDRLESIVVFDKYGKKKFDQTSLDPGSVNYVGLPEYQDWVVAMHNHPNLPSPFSYGDLYTSLMFNLNVHVVITRCVVYIIEIPNDCFTWNKEQMMQFIAEYDSARKQQNQVTPEAYRRTRGAYLALKTITERHGMQLYAYGSIGKACNKVSQLRWQYYQKRHSTRQAVGRVAERATQATKYTRSTL